MIFDDFKTSVKFGVKKLKSNFHSISIVVVPSIYCSFNCSFNFHNAQLNHRPPLPKRLPSLNWSFTSPKNCWLDQFSGLSWGWWLWLGDLKKYGNQGAGYPDIRDLEKASGQERVWIDKSLLFSDQNPSTFRNKPCAKQEVMDAIAQHVR